MKRNSVKILTTLLAVLLLFSGCINKEAEEIPGTDQIDMSNVNQNSIGGYQTMQYHYLTNADPAWLTTNLNPAYLLLVNKNNALGDYYTPSPLTVLTCPLYQPNRTYELESRAAMALYAMIAEMQAAGVNDIMVASAYRSYDSQSKLYDDYILKEMSYISKEARLVLGESYIKANYLDKKSFKLTYEDAQIVVQTYSAKAGQSEHQSGLCVDFATNEEGEEILTEAFENTKAFAWLSQNAYKFGFILRYPKGMEDITGYNYEPWHYRFVGREAATDIRVGQMTLEQYLQLTTN